MRFEIMLTVESEEPPHVVLSEIVAVLEFDAERTKVQHGIALHDAEEIARFIRYGQEGEEKK